MISAVVPTHRGRTRLERNLDSVAASLAASGDPWEIVVVDDGGGDLGPLPEGTRLLPLDRNRGYGPAVNAGARAAKGEYLLVLNDDVRLEHETIARLRRHFPDAGLFAAVPAILSRLAACGDEGGKRGRWRGGELEIIERPSAREQPTLYPVGCCFLCPRAAFLELGGYDDVFAPFFWEDVDLGYRAWRRGLRLVHVPEAVCHHEGSATLAEQRTAEEREATSFRNRVLFHLRNLQDPVLRAECYGAWVAHALFEGHAERLRGLAEAVERFAQAGPRADPGLADAAILERLGNAG